MDHEVEVETTRIDRLHAVEATRMTTGVTATTTMTEARHVEGHTMKILHVDGETGIGTMMIEATTMSLRVGRSAEITQTSSMDLSLFLRCEGGIVIESHDDPKTHVTTMMTMIVTGVDETIEIGERTEIEATTTTTATQIAVDAMTGTIETGVEIGPADGTMMTTTATTTIGDRGGPIATKIGTSVGTAVSRPRRSKLAISMLVSGNTHVGF
jgi:hypothetical protein